MSTYPFHNNDPASSLPGKWTSSERVVWNNSTNEFGDLLVHLDDSYPLLKAFFTAQVGIPRKCNHVILSKLVVEPNFRTLVTVWLQVERENPRLDDAKSTLRKIYRGIQNMAVETQYWATIRPILRTLSSRGCQISAASLFSP